MNVRQDQLTDPSLNPTVIEGGGGLAEIEGDNLPPLEAIDLESALVVIAQMRIIQDQQTLFIEKMYKKIFGSEATPHA